LVGHLKNAQAADKHLDKATDKLFPAGGLATIAKPLTGGVRASLL
jgi:hypothetical protein